MKPNPFVLSNRFTFPVAMPSPLLDIARRAQPNRQVRAFRRLKDVRAIT
jgi:hypothetical protein